MSPSPRRPLRGIPTSRAYWELKAEQMMNRVFDPEATIDLDVASQAEPPPTLPLAPSVRRLRGRPAAPAPAPSRADRNTLLLTAMGGVCMVSVASSVLYLTHSSRMQQALSQERSLLLVERLRSLGPANPSPLGAGVGANLAGGPSVLPLASDQLPPPPEEPWIEQLSQLPQPEGSRAPVLRVPVSPKLAAAAPPATGGDGGYAQRSAAPAPGPVPELVGVVGSAGRPASAIFQMGGSSTSVSVGEAIGSSGWRLRSADGDTAMIERGGEVRRISISNGY
ncbi:hypothetical protein [Cyanobium sp. Lug-B]|uniref:hypothetical protein n=1 Tax=Cyanobium sp. Lug-B TaxID=2823716 RepID=UPI0020CCBB75|nr:hypothetical protein [Cyanobium sp. Lug-B]MCP9796900.1 hypothetical protein [Cyanobium sp. Lug-B]